MTIAAPSRLSSFAALGSAALVLAGVYACSASDETPTVDSKAKAADCDKRCDAYLETCADSNVSCTEICGADFELTEGELACLEGANCKEVDSKKKDCVTKRAAKVNGVLATEYFPKFTYEQIETCMDGAASIPTQANGSNMARMSLFLNEDNTFVLYYREGKGKLTPEEAPPYFINFTQDGVRVEGEWSIEDASLVVGEYAVCTGTKDAFDNDALSCSLTKTLVSKAAVSKLATLQISDPKIAIDDETEWADYAAPYVKPDAGADSGVADSGVADDAGP